MGEGWRESDSEAFSRFGDVFTPGREEIGRVILDHVPAEREETFLVVGIGCGNGWLGEAILREFPNARLIALDGSEEMLRHAGETLSPHAARVESRLFRLEEEGWVSRIEEPVRRFTSSLAIHHLDGAGKQEMYRELRKKLEPSGAFLYADVVEAKSERGRSHMARVWSEEVRRRSLEIIGDEDVHRLFVEGGWNMYDHPDGMDKPSGTVEQLRWLEDAGYEGVDVPWARAGHAVFCAYEPMER